MNEQNLPVIDYSNEVICEKILLDQSEEIYDKMIQDLTIKTVPAVASDSYSDSSQLSLLSRKELSDVQTTIQIPILSTVYYKYWLFNIIN